MLVVSYYLCQIYIIGITYHLSYDIGRWEVYLKMDMDDYKRMYWDDIKRFGSSVILIDIDNPGWIKEIDLEEKEREELLVVNKYIEHNSNEYGREGLVNVYDITDRATDNKGNLILFVKNNSIGYQR